MKNIYGLKIAALMLIPSLLIGFIVFHYKSYFQTISNEFSNVSVYEERAAKIRNGELTLTQSEIADLYQSLASGDTKIANGASLMSSSTQYYLLILVLILIAQSITLFGVFRSLKNHDG